MICSVQAPGHPSGQRLILMVFLQREDLGGSDLWRHELVPLRVCLFLSRAEGERMQAMPSSPPTRHLPLGPISYNWSRILTLG